MEQIALACRPHWRERLIFSLAAAVAVGVASWNWSAVPEPAASDFSQLWAAAGYWTEGQNPYDVVGPDRPFQWRYPLLYPLPGVITALPFVSLPLGWANCLFSAIGAGALVWTLTAFTLKNPQLLGLISIPFVITVQLAQWSPLLIAAAFQPWLGWLLACKPSTAAMLFSAFPRWQALAGSSAFITLSLVLMPSWPTRWLDALGTATHMVPGVLLPGGVLVLLALLKWRRAEARLLLSMACIPHTLSLYECVPLFLVVRRSWEGLLLVACAVIAYACWQSSDRPTFDAHQAWAARWSLWMLYLPCTALVLTRPNVWSVDSRVGAPDR